MTSDATKFIRMDENLINSDVSRRIKLAMIDASVSKSALSKASGVPYATLDRKLQALSSFNMTELVRIARALNMSMAQIIPDDHQGAAA